MAVIYNLRDPNYTIPTETVKRIAEPTSVNSFVDLKADRGSGAELVQQIRDLARLPAFDQRRFDQFCEGCNVTEEVAGSQKERLGIGRPWRQRADACQSSALDKWLE